MAILLSVGCLGFWVPDFLPSTDSTQYQVTGVLTTLFLTLVNAVVIVFLMYQRGITHKLSGLPIVLYLLAIGVIPMLHTQWLLQIVILLLQIVLLLVMNSYRNEHAVQASFLSSIFLCLTALLVPDMLILIPILWLMFMMQRAFNLRVLLASLIGCGVVALYVVLFRGIGWIELVDWDAIWIRSTIELNFTYKILLSVITIAGAFFLIANFIRQERENTSITTSVWCLMAAFVPCAILMFFPPAYFASLLIVAIYSLVALSTYFFASRESIFAGITFLLFLVLLIGIYFIPYFNR